MYHARADTKCMFFAGPSHHVIYLTGIALHPKTPIATEVIQHWRWRSLEVVVERVAATMNPCVGRSLDGIPTCTGHEFEERDRGIRSAICLHSEYPSLPVSLKRYTKRNMNTAKNAKERDYHGATAAEIVPACACDF